MDEVQKKRDLDKETGSGGRVISSQCVCARVCVCDLVTYLTLCESGLGVSDLSDWVRVSTCFCREVSGAERRRSVAAHNTLCN